MQMQYTDRSVHSKWFSLNGLYVHALSYVFENIFDDSTNTVMGFSVDRRS